MKKIALYNDIGVSTLSLHATQQYFQNNTVELLTAEDIYNNKLDNSFDLFIMPGGRDRPYHQKLSGTGNQNILKYVEAGGTYLGICAGAYYGCRTIEFQKETKQAICEDRECAFFEGTAVGCLSEISGILYNEKLSSASATSVTIQNQSYNTLYWGGCYFIGPIDQEYIIATYDSSKNRPAIIYQNMRKGKAILSGVHFEINHDFLTTYETTNSEENQKIISLANKLNHSTKTLSEYMKEYLSV